MHIAGQLKHPVSVTIQPPKIFSRISTGLDPVAGKINTFFASDFDALYDCPIYLGNQEVLSFEVRGITHYLAFENPKSFDTQKLAADLKKIVEVAVSVIGNIPYHHYTFIIMGPGQGGLEHRNSTAVFSGSQYTGNNPTAYKNWLAFLTHEYFHLYNIKSIRPIALGPFDYDRENYTNMLWVSEGITVYYEYVILNRAGIMNREECFQQLSKNIMNYENIPGHLFQSATQSSFDTWIQFFSRGDNASNTTISYYDKGCILGMLMDLKIRHQTSNKKSLDDVMRKLYGEFYLEKKRGFTDKEFRDVCDNIAGTNLEEIFSYASTVTLIDYPKYLSYTDWILILHQKNFPEPILAHQYNKRGENLVVTGIVWNSPAWYSGLSSQDEILELDGSLATAKAWDELLNSKQAGQKIMIAYSSRNIKKETEIVLTKKIEKHFISVISQILARSNCRY